MSVINFNRADALLTASSALVYGPVPTGTVAVLFHGTASNVDNTNKSTHNFVLNIHSGASVINRMNAISTSYGSAAKVPKMVLKAGESLYALAGTTNVVQLSVEVLEIVG